MQYRPARESDFDHLETFVWQAIFPDFDVDGLTEEERAENDRLVATAKKEALGALTDGTSIAVVARDERRRTLAGYILMTKSADDYLVSQLFVRRADRGRGVGERLVAEAIGRLASGGRVYAAIRKYNQRAIAFFTKLGFSDTGEGGGDFMIDRILMERVLEAGTAPLPDTTTDAGDFPTEADEPYFEPVYEAIPDHRLASEELSAELNFDPETSSLDQEQLSELEDFIARAKLKKSQDGSQEKKSAVETEGADREPVYSRHPEIELEIDYGEPDRSEKQDTPPPGLDFEFVFDEAVSPEPEASEPDPAPAPAPANELEEEEVLELREIPEQREVSTTELRHQFEDRLGERLTAYFGTDRLTEYLRRYHRADNFHRIRDASLQRLATWLNTHPPAGRGKKRTAYAMGELIEYFIVETVGDLSDGVLPQRLLRFQGAEWKDVDQRKLVMTYLDFDAESERVYTDFVTIPPKVLKNATASFLRASRDERLFLICDQSLFGTGKQGFAFTDSGVYWKNVLQPPAMALFTTISDLRRNEDHLTIDGQYFDAGPSLNLKVSLLLDKLRRMEPLD